MFRCPWQPGRPTYEDDLVNDTHLVSRISASNRDDCMAYASSVGGLVPIFDDHFSAAQPAKSRRAELRFLYCLRLTRNPDHGSGKRLLGVRVKGSIVRPINGYAILRAVQIHSENRGPVLARPLATQLVQPEQLHGTSNHRGSDIRHGPQPHPDVAAREPILRRIERG